MGKLTKKEAEQLQKEGILTDEAMNEMEDLGLVGRKSRGTKRVMKAKNNSWVSPQFYFRGLSRDGEYSKKMTELRNKVNELFEEYTTTLNK
tara:strand:- start:646 stop:918 length:273 start_codon:yes stop_codon:yes gene_type:complete